MIEHLINHVVTRWLERRLERDALDITAEPVPGATWRLQYSRLFRLFWLAQAVFWGAAVGLFVWAGVNGLIERRVLSAAILFAAILAFSIVMVRDGFTQQIELSAAGMTELRSGAMTTFLPWSSVRRVEFIGWLDSYRVVSDGGASVRFSNNIRGLPRFKWLCRRYAPAQALAGVAERFFDLTRL